MKECPEGSFEREKGSNLCQVSHPKIAIVLNLLVIYLDPKLIRSVPLKLSDPRSLLDWALRHRFLSS